MDFPLTQFRVRKTQRRRHRGNSSSDDDDEADDSTYSLAAVITHNGSIDAGHYVTYALNEASDEWILFDDSEVIPVTEEEVAQTQAYVLFYKYVQQYEALLVFPRSAAYLII